MVLAPTGFHCSQTILVILGLEPLYRLHWCQTSHLSHLRQLFQRSNEIYEPLDHFLEHQSKHQQRIVAFKPYPIKANGTVSTMHDRPDRYPIGGFQKKWRSFHRALDRLLNNDPWFPK